MILWVCLWTICPLEAFPMSCQWHSTIGSPFRGSGWCLTTLRLSFSGKNLALHHPGSWTVPEPIKTSSRAFPIFYFKGTHHTFVAQLVGLSSSYSNKGMAREQQRKHLHICPLKCHTSAKTDLTLRTLENFGELQSSQSFISVCWCMPTANWSATHALSMAFPWTFHTKNTKQQQRNQPVIIWPCVLVHTTASRTHVPHLVCPHL